MFRKLKSPCRPCRGYGYTGPMCDACSGHGSRPQLKSVYVTIQPGWIHGHQLVFPAGADQVRGLNTGAILVTLAEMADPTVERDGDDLRIVHPLDLQEALNGFSHTVMLLPPNQVTLTRNGVTQPEQVIAYQQQGMPKTEGGGRGCLWVTYRVTLPTTLSPSQHHILRQNWSGQ